MTRWPRVTRRDPCPMCGSTRWCVVSPDSNVLRCERVLDGPGARAQVDRNGKSYALYFAPGIRPRALAPVPTRPTARRAEPADLDRGYRELLDALGLGPAHRAALAARGLAPEAIARAEYRTLELRGRARLAARVIERVGEPLVAQLPGFYRAESGDRAWWSLGGQPGLVIPVRDVVGRVVALKIRPDAPGDGPRYVYLSSASHGGPAALAAVHVPAIASASPELRVTEGEIKADVCSVLSGIRTVSVPGVGNWRLALAVVQQLAPARVHVAFDADWRTNRIVRDAMAALTTALREAGHDAHLETWDPALGKGLDDVLAARAGRAA